MSKSTFLWLVSCLCLFCMPANGQEKKFAKKETVPTDTIPLFQGFAVSTDLVGPGAYLFGSDFMSAEVALEVNLKNRFFPVVEIGYGKTDATNEDSELHYRTSAPYFRVGMDYNVQYKKRLPGYIFAGVRLGYTNFTYDVEGPSLKDPVWGGEAPFAFADVSGNALWGELLAGVKVTVCKNLMMGWSLRYKMRISVSDHPNSVPWYIPGFGANNNTKFGVAYNLIYRIPWKGW